MRITCAQPSTTTPMLSFIHAITNYTRMHKFNRKPVVTIQDQYFRCCHESVFLFLLQLLCHKMYVAQHWFLGDVHVWYRPTYVSTTKFSQRTPNFYRPQRSCGQGYVFTGVCDSVHRGGSPENPPDQGEPPWTKENPPRPGRHPPSPPTKEKPPGRGRHPPGPRRTPPRTKENPPPRKKTAAYGQ